MPKGISKLGKNKGWFKKGSIPMRPIKKGEHRSKRTEFKKGMIAWSKGKKMSEDFRRKIGEAHKGQTAWNKGKKWPEEVKEKISKSKIGIPNFKNRGKNSANWEGGRTKLVKQIRQTLEYKEWRKKVFERDNYTCQICFKKGGEMVAHHWLKSFSQILSENNIKTLKEALNNKELWDTTNGKSLCLGCHKLIHKKEYSQMLPTILKTYEMRNLC